MLSKSLILTRLAPHISCPGHCIPNILEKQYLHCHRPQGWRSQDSYNMWEESSSEILNIFIFDIIIPSFFTFAIIILNSTPYFVKSSSTHLKHQKYLLLSVITFHMHSVRPFMILVSCLKTINIVS